MGIGVQAEGQVRWYRLYSQREESGVEPGVSLAHTNHLHDRVRSLGLGHRLSH
jgi:hypothetical protein